MSNKNRYNQQVSPMDVLTKAQEPKTEEVPEEKKDVVVEETPKQEPSKPSEEFKATPLDKQEETPKEQAKETTPTVNTTVQQKTVAPANNKTPDAKVAKLDALLKKYQDLVQTKNPSESTRARFVEAFYAVAEYVLASDSYAVFNRFYDFFLKEKNGLIHRNLALSGIHKITDLQKKSRISAFFAVFYAMIRHKTERKPFGLSIRAIRLALKNDKFCNWIQAKLQNR